MDKRGQFFLIAALIIVGIILTLTAVNISIKSPPQEDVVIYDLSKEIKYESNQLIDYGVYASLSSGEINRSVLSLIGNYSASNPDTDILMIYGNKDSAVSSVLFSEEPSGFEAISTGAAPIRSDQFKKSATYLPTQIIESGNKVKIILNEDSSLEFDLKEGENFYIILQKEKEEEKFVAQ